ncbi:MAG: flavin reductase family protein [Steroidobacteraceae bacterium]|nr:flavin reductase family protein [Steroidobacteraceae bacterium]
MQPRPPGLAEPAEFRRVLGHFCTGLTIVTGSLDGTPYGFTCQSFFSLSLEPPLVAFSPSRISRSYPSIRRSGAFCINILAEGQADLGQTFARSGIDKWSGVAWRAGTTGSPIIDGVLGWIDCSLEAEHDGGDHWLTVGRVVAMDAREGRPLLYFKGGFTGLAPQDER